MQSVLTRPEPRHDKPDAVRACVHDLRNLFAVVASAKSLLDRPLDERTKAMIVDALCRVAADGKVLTNGLLAGGVEDRGCGTDASDELQGLAPILQALENPTLKIALSIDDQPSWLLMPPWEFRAVVLELVTNAARAGSRTIRIRAARRDCRFWLMVADDGSGFSDSGPAEPLLAGLHGTGLRRLASAVGSAYGKVMIRSAQGRGTVVALTLPIVRLLPTARPTRVPAGSASHIGIREKNDGKRAAH